MKNEWENMEEGAKPVYGKKRKYQGGKGWLALIGICICVIAFSGYQLISIFLEYKAGTDEYEDLQQYVMAEVPEDNYVFDLGLESFF